MDLLLNFDTSRIATYTETTKIPDDGLYKLKYVPKENTISISGFSVITVGTPTAKQVYIDYAVTRDYFGATGILEFNVADAGQTITIVYVPVGSRVDADDLNPMLQWYGNLNGKLYTKDELKGKGTAIIDWSNIVNGPTNATEAASGFMSFIDKRAVNTIDPNKKPIGSVIVGESNFAPTVWGGALTVGTTTSIKPSIVDGILKFDVDPATPGLVPSNILAALAGTYGAPGANNRYVTENDTRITNPTMPVHHHSIDQVDNLQLALDGKAAVSHTQDISTINGLTEVLAGKASSIHIHEVADVTGLSDDLAGKAPIVHVHDDLVTAINGKASTIHRHTPNDIDGFEETVQGIIAGDPTANAAANINPYELTEDLANLDALVNDFNVSGLDVASTSAFNVTLNPGSQYAGGKRVALASADVANLNCIAYTKPAPQGATPTTRYPIITGMSDATGARTYTITVTQANRNPGMYLDLTLNVHDSTGVKGDFTLTWSQTSYSTRESAMQTLGNGFYLEMLMNADTTYVVGDSWTVDFLTTGYTTIYIDGADGTLGYIASTSSTTPTLPATASPVLKAQLNGSAISTVTDLRPLQNKPTLKEVYGVTQSITDNSDKLATTGFTQSFVGDYVSTYVSQHASKTNQVGTFTNEQSYTTNQVRTIALPNSIDTSVMSISVYFKVDASTYRLCAGSQTPFQLDIDTTTGSIVFTSTAVDTTTFKIVVIGGLV